MTYDPDLRRHTPLARQLAERIRRSGPISVADYMSACLGDAEHGYYVRQPAIGRAGDFVTAPEISQVFGELVGLWCAVVWRQMGAPAAFNLIELGPGRGTMMADVLRATRVVPGFRAAAHVHMIEISDTLRDRQRTALEPHAGGLASLSWHASVADIWRDHAGTADRPTILIGNEFLDTLPADQFERRGKGWVQRRIGLDPDGWLTFSGPRSHDGLGPPKPLETAELDSRFGACGEGDIVTVGQYGLMDDVVGPWPVFAALLIDYGHAESRPGDTLQAVREHVYEHPLTSPGEADLTTLVDFSAVAARVRGHREDIAFDGPVSQAEFLGQLGIIERASRLMSANPAEAARIEADVARLIAPGGMGSRFKVLGLRSNELPTLPGLAR